MIDQVLHGLQSITQRKCPKSEMPFMRDGSQCLIADTSLQWLKDYQGSRNDLLTLRTGKAPEETM